MSDVGMFADTSARDAGDEPRSRDVRSNNERETDEAPTDSLSTMCRILTL